MGNVELKLKDTINDNDIYDIYIDDVYAGGLEANYDPRINSFYIENIKKSDSYKTGHLLEDVVNYLYNDKRYDLGCLPLEKYRGYYEELGFTPFIYNDNDVYYHKIHKGDNMKTDEFLTELKNIINEDLNKGNTMWEFTAPWFPGFYEGSIYYPDGHNVEYELFNNPNDVPEAILDWCKDNADIEDWEGYKNEICENYIDSLNEVMSEIIPNFNAEFVDVDSPSDYNYGNDRCFGKINWNLIKEDVLDYINNNRDTFKEYVRERYSDRPGFWSNYEADADKWDLEGELDHNELGTLFGFILYNEGKITGDDFRENVLYNVYPHWHVDFEELKQNFKFDVEPENLEDLENYVYDSNTDTYKRRYNMKTDEFLNKVKNIINEDNMSELKKELDYLYKGIGWAEWDYFKEGLAYSTNFKPEEITDEDLEKMINASGIAKVKKVEEIKDYSDMEDFDPKDFNPDDKIILTKKPMSNQFYSESSQKNEASMPLSDYKELYRMLGIFQKDIEEEYPGNTSDMMDYWNNIGELRELIKQMWDGEEF